MPRLSPRPVNRFLSGKPSLAARFADERVRFRLAVTAGFFLAAVSFLVVGADTRFGSAQSLLGLLGLPDGGIGAPRYLSGQEGGAAALRHARRHHAQALRAKAGHRVGSVAQVTLVTRKSVCVRLCDGYAFPLGNYAGDADRPAHEAACRSGCPGARTALYVLPAGSDTLAEATDARTGRHYSQMAEAFRYTTYVDETCACHPPGGGGVRSLLHDFTLRRGDAVMTPQGLQVFHGGTGFPFKRRAFVALIKSRDIRRADRSSLQAIERASLTSPGPASTTVASVATPISRRATTKALEHQARN